MNQRGIALPTALIALAILTALMIAFTVLARSEPTIATNHELTTRARAFAESGLEQAIWALSNPGAARGLADPLPAAMPAAYAGGFTAVEIVNGVTQGGFRLTVVNAASGNPNDRDVTSVGLVPDTNNPRAIRKVLSTVTHIHLIDPPCAICVQGDLKITGNATVDARGGACADGPPPVTGSLTSGITQSNSGATKIYGPGNDVPNEATDVQAGAPSSMFGFKFSDAELGALKAIAKANGTYYQGAVSFGTSNPMPNGIVFVDTTTGAPFTTNTPDTEAGFASVHGQSSWSGWLIVEGSIDISSNNVALQGLIYALNDLKFNSGSITGAMVSENRKDASSTLIDSTISGGTTLTYDCKAIRNGGPPKGWFVKAGTYREPEGQ